MNIPSTEQFWQFSEQHYARPGVAAACLQLQDDYGANVNLLLLLVMLEERGLSVDLSPLLPIVRQRAGLFNQWRPLRRQLKDKLSTENYLALLHHELELERWQQQELIATLNQTPPSTGSDSGLLSYLSLLTVPDAPLWQLRLAT